MLRIVRGWHLTSPHSRFGGLSAVAVMAAGRFQFVADTGYWSRLTLHPDGGVAAFHIAALPTPDGRRRKKSMIDAEAMIYDPLTGKKPRGVRGHERDLALRSGAVPGRGARGSGGDAALVGLCRRRSDGPSCRRPDDPVSRGAG